MNERNGAPPPDDPTASGDGAAQEPGSHRVTPPRDGTDATSRLLRQLERLAEQTSQPAMRVPLLHRLARTWEERGGDPDRALSVLADALELRPRDHKTRAELERLAERYERWEALAQTWARIADESDDRAARVDLLVGLAHLLDERLGRPDESRERWEQVLALDPTHEEALRAVVAAWREAGRDADLADVLPRLVAATESPNDRAMLLLDLGALRERTDSPAEATGAYENAGEILGDDPRVLEPLARLYRGAERWNDLVGVLDRLAAIDPTRQAELRLEAGRICEDRLDSAQRAIALYEALLNAQPGSEEALQRLSELYVEREDWTGLAGVFERQLEAATDEAERAELCRQLAVLSEDAFADSDRAATWWRLLLGHAPEHGEAFEALRRIYREAERWSDLVTLLSERAALPDQVAEERCELRLEVARLLRFRLDDADGAVQVIEAVLAESPEHETAARLLEELLRGSGDQKRLVDLLDRKLERAATPPERAVVHLERAEAFKESGRTGDAIDAYRAALGDAPGMVTALTHLVRALAEDGRDAELAETLRGALDAVRSGEVRADLQCELAEAYRRLGDLDGATDAFERALESFPYHQAAAEALADVYIGEERWPEALPLLEIRLPSLDTEGQPVPSAVFLNKIGRVVEALGEYERAASFLGMADSLAPDVPETVGALARLAQRLGREEEAARRYAQLLALTDGALGDAVPAEGEVQARAMLMHHALAGGDLDAAEGHAKAVLAAMPEDPGALQSLAVVADRREDWETAVAVRRRLLEARTGPDEDPLERLKIRMELGTLLEERLGDLEAARAFFREAADEATEARAPLLKLLEVQTTLDRPEEALATLARLCEHARRPEEQARYHFTAARLLTALGREDEATEQFLRTVENDLERTDALREAEERLETSGDLEGVATALARVAAVARDRGAPHLARNLLRRLGEHHVKRTEDLDRAAAAYREACTLDPHDRRLRERLVEILGTAGRTEEAVEELRELLARQPEQSALWRALLDLFDRANQPDGAASTLGVLTYTEQATPAERMRYDSLPIARLSEASGRVAGDACARIAAPGARGTALASLMRLLHENLGDALEARTLKDEGLRKGDEIEPSQDLLFLRTLRAATVVLGVPAPPVFFEQQGRGFRVLPVSPPAFAIGPGLLKGRREAELAFVIGKGLTYLRPDFATAGIFSAATLRALVRCARAWADPESWTPPVDTTRRRRVEAIVKALERRLDAETGDEIRALVPACNEADVVGWLQAVSATANRVGLLCCGDVATAAHLCARPITSFEVPVEGAESIMDLALFSVSASYLDLRSQLFGI